jgi:cell division protein FtsB
MSEQLRRLTDKELKSPAQIYIEELEAENARLQARVEEAEAEVERLDRGNGVWRQECERLTVDRDGYNALAERLRKALEPFAKITDGLLQVWSPDTMPDDYVVLGQPDPRALYCVTWGELKEARAALNTTPEEAREKE